MRLIKEQNVQDNTVQNILTADTTETDSAKLAFRRMTTACYKMSFAKLCEQIRIQNSMYYAALTVAMDKSINDYVESHSMDKVYSVLKAMAGLKEQGIFGREFCARINAVELVPGKDGMTVELAQAAEPAIEYKNGNIVRTAQWAQWDEKAVAKHYDTAKAIQSKVARTRFGELKAKAKDVTYEQKLHDQLKTLLMQYNKACKAGKCLDSTKTMMNKIVDDVVEAGFLTAADL